MLPHISLLLDTPTWTKHLQLRSECSWQELRDRIQATTGLFMDVLYFRNESMQVQTVATESEFSSLKKRCPGTMHLATMPFPEFYVYESIKETYATMFAKIGALLDDYKDVMMLPHHNNEVMRAVHHVVHIVLAHHPSAVDIQQLRKQLDWLSAADKKGKLRQLHVQPLLPDHPHHLNDAPSSSADNQLPRAASPDYFFSSLPPPPPPPPHLCGTAHHEHFKNSAKTSSSLSAPASPTLIDHQDENHEIDDFLAPPPPMYEPPRTLTDAADHDQKKKKQLRADVLVSSMNDAENDELNEFDEFDEWHGFAMQHHGPPPFFSAPTTPMEDPLLSSMHQDPSSSLHAHHRPHPHHHPHHPHHPPRHHHAPPHPPPHHPLPRWMKRMPPSSWPRFAPMPPPAAMGAPPPPPPPPMAFMGPPPPLLSPAGPPPPPHLVSPIPTTGANAAQCPYAYAPYAPHPFDPHAQHLAHRHSRDAHTHDAAKDTQGASKESDACDALQTVMDASAKDLSGEMDDGDMDIGLDAADALLLDDVSLAYLYQEQEFNHQRQMLKMQHRELKYALKEMKRQQRDWQQHHQVVEQHLARSHSLMSNPGSTRADNRKNKQPMANVHQSRRRHSFSSRQQHVANASNSANSPMAVPVPSSPSPIPSSPTVSDLSAESTHLSSSPDSLNDLLPLRDAPATMYQPAMATGSSGSSLMRDLTASFHNLTTNNH
ncbi:hypothetical protein BC940DRAFT_310174 [Gongronella butleri]|nr:hypothetical protein BC940DRAFT_310174 [Gongronella butleri]